MTAEGLDVRSALDQALIPGAPFHSWTFPDGTPWTDFHRVEGGYLLRFPDLADFEIAEEGHRVTCVPALGVTDATVQHLYLNQVLPLVFSKLGQLVFHASVVEIGGSAVAFLGESGRGKSTLAASFAVNRFRFLTDDGLMVTPGVPGFDAQPSHPSIRLWEDSEAALIAPGTRQAPPVHYTPKARFLAGEDLPFCDEALPLRRVYVLGDGTAPDATIEPLMPAQALIELVKHSFLMDVEDQPRLASHFDQVGTLANQPMHFRLDYPRRFDGLTAVRRAILTHVQEYGDAQ